MERCLPIPAKGNEMGSGAAGPSGVQGRGAPAFLQAKFLPTRVASARWRLRCCLACESPARRSGRGVAAGSAQSPFCRRARDQMSNCVSSSLRTDRAFVSRKDYGRFATSSGSGAQAVLAADKSPHWPTHTGW